MSISINTHLKLLRKYCYVLILININTLTLLCIGDIQLIVVKYLFI